MIAKQLVACLALLARNVTYSITSWIAGSQKMSGTFDGQRLGMILTDEEREGLLYMVREDEEIVQQIGDTLKDKTISSSTRFSSARLWLEVLEKRNSK